MNKTFVAPLFLCLGACASGPQMRGPAVDTPERFDVLDAATGSARPMNPDSACENPLVDPRDGMRLTLVRASEGVGDYEVEAPRYGLSRYELLRVDCLTGVALGRVTR